MEYLGSCRGSRWQKLALAFVSSEIDIAAGAWMLGPAVINALRKEI
jgi:hypothetical protein